jgi:hypothetical protein
MDRSGRDKQFLMWFRAVQRTLNLKLHLALQDDYQFIGGVPEVLPALTR